MFGKVILGVFLVVVAFLPVLALDGTEIAALNALYASFPALLSVNALDEYDSDYSYYGASWHSKSASQVCKGVAGWDIHGIYCNSLGHIEKIRLYVSLPLITPHSLVFGNKEVLTNHYSICRDLDVRLKSTNSWGEQVGTIPTIGLPYLKEFAYRTSSYPGTTMPLCEYSCGHLLSSLSPDTLAALEVLDIPKWSGSYFPSPVMPQLQAIRNLTLFYPGEASTLAIGHLALLEYVNLQTSVSTNILPDFSLFAASNATLSEIYIPNIPITNSGMLMSFSALRIAHIKPGADWHEVHLPANILSLTTSSWPSGAFRLISTTLQSLVLDTPLFNGFTDFSLPSSLQSLSITSMTNAMTWPSKLPSSLRSLKLTNPGNQIVNFVPGLFDDCHDFHTLVISGVSGPAWDDAFPSFRTTSLEKVVLEGATDASRIVNVGKVVCRLPSASLKHLILDETRFGRFPDCISQYTGLETLSLLGSFGAISSNFPEIFENITAPNLVELRFDSRPFNNQNPDWPAVIAQFPNLSKLHFIASPPPTAILPFPADDLMSLTNLTYLSMRGTRLSGVLPTEWFTNHPKLEFLDLGDNRLTGTIPTAGWSVLKYVDLSSNLFTDFPYIESPGAPELEHLILTSNSLESIPSDSVFGSLTKLNTLSVAFNPFLDGFLPLFWTHETSKLDTFLAFGSNLSGSIPSIASPFIRKILIHSNKLCGSLPEVSRSVALHTFQAYENFFQGSVPTSWSSHLTIVGKLAFGSNPVQGPLPNPLVDPRSRFYLAELDLSNTFLSGPFVNLTGYKSLITIDVTGPNMRMDACAAVPAPESFPNTCKLPPDFGCECNHYDQWCTRDGATCPPAPLLFEPGSISPYLEPIIPPIIDCAIPPPSYPSPPSNPSLAPLVVSPCPLPSPGEGFICENGIWHAPGPVVQPNLIVPPGGVVQIDGNLTITEGGVVFNGLESMVVVNGCIFLGSNEVEIELTPQEIEKLSKEGKLSKTLITSLGENGCLGATDLSGTKITSTKGAGSKGCRKLKTSNEGSTRSSLHVVFRIDNTNCNLAIILPSVLVGVALITAAIAVIGYQLYRRKYK